MILYPKELTAPDKGLGEVQVRQGVERLLRRSKVEGFLEGMDFKEEELFGA